MARQGWPVSLLADATRIANALPTSNANAMRPAYAEENRTEENRTLTENLLLLKEENLRLVTRAVAGNRA